VIATRAVCAACSELSNRQTDGWVFATLHTFGLCSPFYGMLAGTVKLLYGDAPTDVFSTRLFSCLCMCETMLLCCSRMAEHSLHTDAARPCCHISFVELNWPPLTGATGLAMCCQGCHRVVPSHTCQHVARCCHTYDVAVSTIQSYLSRPFG